jgi:hypothetical protein
LLGRLTELHQREVRRFQLGIMNPPDANTSHD